LESDAIEVRQLMPPLRMGSNSSVSKDNYFQT